jgi:hypothetical protein
MMSKRDPEYLAAIDSFVENALTRICAPSRDRFVTMEQVIPKIAKHWQDGSDDQIKGAVRRLVRSGRVARETRRFAGNVFSGIVCLPRKEWERLQEPPASTLQLTESDVVFLRGCGVKVDREDVRECVTADCNGAPKLYV